MRFLFVDKITSIEGNKIFGQRTFSADAPMQYNGEIAPGVISEAIGQLVSWLCIEQNGFTARPVFLFADKIEILGAVLPGSTVDLVAWIDSNDGETFVFSGEAAVDGKVVHRVENINGYFMPLADLEDPEIAKERFAKMVSSGLELDGDRGEFDFESLVDEVVEKSTDAIEVTKTMAETESFYKDHFPRFPVTPIVMINEMIGQASCKLLASEGSGLRAVMVKGIKIRNFVRPGDSVTTKVKVKKRLDENKVVALAEVQKGDKLILRGEYTYEIC